MTLPPISGTPFDLDAAGYHAVIAGVGASLRVLRRGDVDLVAPFDQNRMRPAMSGAVLAPWPNRTAGGAYQFAGVRHQLPINELDTNNAAHGLVAWTSFAPLTHTPDLLELVGTIEAQPGYPWRIRLHVCFRLSDRGLTQRITAVNLSDTTAPLGFGGHPYVVAGDVGAWAVDAWTLELPAEEVLLISPDRMLPTARVGVSDPRGRAFDFRSPRRLGDTVINHAYTALRSDADGRARIRLSAADGRGVEVTLDEGCPWVQLYTADAGVGADHRHAVAIEPMTCPPDALNSGTDLVLLEPGMSHHAAWTLGALLAD